MRADRGLYVLIAVTAILAGLFHWPPFASIYPVSILVNGALCMATFFHEIGHSLCHWLFGYPSIPAFDLDHGGGIAWHLDRLWILQGVVLSGTWYLVFLAYQLVPQFLWWVAGIAALFTATALTGFHDVIILFMGNGAEVVIGSIFLARLAIGAVPDRVGERSLHGFVGFFLIFDVIKLCWGLIFDSDAREVYWNQKGTEGFGDFSRIADYFMFSSEIPVAIFCLGFALLALLCPLVLHLKWGRL